jgi:acetolactate synthase small subunit
MDLLITDLENEITEEITRFEVQADGEQVKGILVWSANGGYEIIDITASDKFIEWYQEDENYSQFIDFLENGNIIRKANN